MIPEWVEALLGSAKPTSSVVWLGLFFGVLVVVAAIELLLPAFEDPPQRDRRWPANLGLAAINAGLRSVVPVSTVLAAATAERNELGLLNLLVGPGWIAAAATLLLYSGCGYAVHVLMHKLPILWRLHRVHHLDVRIDVSTSLRSHPLELLVTIALTAAAAVVLGFTPWVVALYEVCESFVSLVSHANLRLPERLDRALRCLLVTPNMHSIHHSAYQPETDSNYGTVLSVWDRLFGTYRHAPAGGYERMEFGLREVRDERASSLLWQLTSPALPRLRRSGASGRVASAIDEVRGAS
jgi:sterol desaturase/sphingolipid hydroxylase (fatty acid hydroxylase superfamily)